MTALDELLKEISDDCDWSTMLDPEVEKIEGALYSLPLIHKGARKPPRGTPSTKSRHSNSGTTGRLAKTPGQEQLERFLAGPVGHGHRFKIHRRKSDGAGSASTVNLPAPRLGGIGPLLYDKGIIIRLKTSGHAGNMRLRVTCRQRNQTHSFRGTLSN